MSTNYRPRIGSSDSKSARPAAKIPPSRKLQVEHLDERLAMAAGFAVLDGTLVVVGTTGSDNIWISDDYGSKYNVNINGQRIGQVSKSSVYMYNVRIYGDAGNDTISVNANLPLRLEAHGGSGEDTIWGTRYNDYLYGDGDGDKIYGQDGNDYIDGGAGNDSVLSGGNGSDTILGGTGNDTLYGDGGRDYLFGNIGADIFMDYDGQDSVTDSGGNNQWYRINRWIRF